MQQIYVACLAAYNNGHLHGAWIPCIDEDQMNEDIKKLLASSPVHGAEEWVIGDHEGLGAISEYESVAAVMERVEFINEVENEALAQELLNYHGGNIADAINLYENFYGSYDSPEDFARSMAEDTGDLANVSSWLQYHIDWESVARDLLCDGYIEFRIDGISYIFSQ